MKRKLRVSVVIPAYNQAQYLGSAIQSVLDQTRRDFEVIVVDDGSTDHTRQVVKATRDERVYYIYQMNKGLPGARNTGIRASSGEYIAFLDADDLFLPDKLDIQIAFLDENPVIGLAAGGYFFINHEGAILREQRPWLSFPTLTLEHWLLGQPFVPAAILVRRTWLERVGLFDESLRAADEDWDLYLRLAHAGCEMRWLERPMCKYRIHASNVTRNPAAMKSGGLSVLDKFFADLTLPDEIKALQPLARSRVYLDAACRGYAGGFVQEAQADLQQAIELDPGLLDGHPPRALSAFASWALTPYVRDPSVFLDTVLSNLPDNAATLRWSRRRVRGLLRAVAAFEHYQCQKYRHVVKETISALALDPNWLCNRGLISIVGHSLVGSFVHHDQAQNGN